MNIIDWYLFFIIKLNKNIEQNNNFEIKYEYFGKYKERVNIIDKRTFKLILFNFMYPEIEYLYNEYY